MQIYLIQFQKYLGKTKGKTKNIYILSLVIYNNTFCTNMNNNFAV